MIFRQEIYEYQMAKFDKIIGSVNLMKVASKAINKVKLKIDRGTSMQHVFGVATKKFYQNHTLYEKGNTLIERKIDVKRDLY